MAKAPASAEKGTRKALREAGVSEAEAVPWRQ